MCSTYSRSHCHCPMSFRPSRRHVAAERHRRRGALATRSVDAGRARRPMRRGLWRPRLGLRQRQPEAHRLLPVAGGPERHQRRRPGPRVGIRQPLVLDLGGAAIGLHPRDGRSRIPGRSRIAAPCARHRAGGAPDSRSRPARSGIRSRRRRPRSSNGEASAASRSEVSCQVAASVCSSPEVASNMP